MSEVRPADTRTRNTRHTAPPQLPPQEPAQGTGKGKDRKNAPGPRDGAHVVPRAQHQIDLQQIPAYATGTVVDLQNAGFEAYLVGGAVRDLLLGKIPKDFDVATNATPEQVRRVFRRARIIGRRFRLVHVLHGDETVEVSTFRGAGEAETDAEGRILHDNHWGTRRDDARRRDFTLNALFYDPVAQTVIDYHQGFAHLKGKKLVMIGDPATRYREDPVRILRAARLSAKLDLTIDATTRAPIRELSPLLRNVPAARLLDEMLKLLFSGKSWSCLCQLRAEGLHAYFFPLLDEVLSRAEGECFLRTALEATDARIAHNQPISAGYLFAALLWQDVLRVWKARKADGVRPLPALFDAMDEVEAVQAEKLAIPRRYSTTMKEIWRLQPRFDLRSAARAHAMLAQPRFAAALDFLALRALVEPECAPLATWWQNWRMADAPRRAELIAELTPSAPSTAPARKLRRHKSPDTATPEPTVPPVSTQISLKQE